MADPAGPTRRRRYKGRNEAGIDADLRNRDDMSKSERAALRSQARALDIAEDAGDPDVVTRVNHGYLELRTAAGLSSGGAKPLDAFDELLRSISEPTPGNSNPAAP